MATRRGGRPSIKVSAIKPRVIGGGKDRQADKQAAQTKSPVQRRSTFSWLTMAAGLAFSFWRAGQRQRHQLETLRPHNVPIQQAAKRPPVQEKPGLDADAPHQIPALGWWQVANRVAKKFSENELLSEAAGCTFYALLSLFPAITAIVSIYGLFADRSTIEGQLDQMSGFLPSGGMDIIREQVHRLVESPAGGLTIGAVAGVLTALWSANAGTKAMFSALNDVYGEREERGFVKVTLMSLAFTLGGIAFLLFGVGLIVVLPSLFKAVGLGSAFALVAGVVRLPVVLLALVGALAVLYRYGPSRRPAQWRWVTWGGAIGALLWIGLSIGFSWYVAHFGSYNKTYGSLGAIIGFMTWIWLSTTVLLVGAQINAELETQTERDSTIGADRPVGARGAAPADIVA